MSTLYSCKVELKLLFLLSFKYFTFGMLRVNLVPSVSHLTAPWSERVTQQAN